MTRLSSCVVAVILGGWASAAVPPPPVAMPAPAVSWRPVAPVQGSLVILEVHPPAGDSVLAVRGELAGGPLHFHRAGEILRAIGGIPLTAHDSLAMRLVIERATGATATLALSMGVAP